MQHRSAGAVAEIYDLACLPQSAFANATDRIWDAWKAASSTSKPLQAVKDAGVFKLNPPYTLGQHYFVKTPGLSPKWDFTSSGKFAGNQDAYFIGAPVGNVPAPSNPAKSVAWLHIGHVDGELADEVFRYDTVGGQPPTSVRLCWKGWCVRVSADVDVFVVHSRKGQEPVREVRLEVW